MRTQSYIHVFDVAEYVAVGLSISTKGGAGALVEQPPAVGRTWGFPTSGVNFVRTSEFAPSVRTAWGFIDPIIDEPETYAGAGETSVSYRISSAGVAYFWDGSAWAVAGSSDWNTLADVNDNLPTFTRSSLAVEARLSTTNARLSPAVGAIKLRWTGKAVDTLKTWIYGALITSWREGIRPLTTFALRADGTAIYNLTPLLSDEALAGFSEIEVLEVFNDADDPEHLIDLLASYTGGTMTLTSAQSAGAPLHVTARYAPLIAVTTDADFEEQAKSPAILVTMIRPENDSRRALGTKGPHAIDRTLAVPAGTVFPHPVPLTSYQVGVAFSAPLSVDLLALASAFSAWMRTHPTLRSPALDESVRVTPGFSPDWATDAGLPVDVRSASAALRLVDIPCYESGETGNSALDSAVRVGPVDAGDPDFPGDGYGVAQVNVSARVLDGTGTSNTTI